MGWFSKKQSREDEWSQRLSTSLTEPFPVDDRIVARVAELMTMWNEAVGNDPRMRATASGISSAAGVDDQFFMSAAWIDNPAVVQERPWQMLAAVAQHAAQHDDHILAAKIFGFTWFWNTQIAPHLRPADWFDMRLDKVPPAIEAEIATIALRSLPQLPADQVIFGNATGSLDAGALTHAAATTLLKAADKGMAVDANAVIAAKNCLGR